MNELKILISDILLSWSFRILPKNYDDKQKMAMLIINRYEPRKYTIKPDEGILSRLTEERGKDISSAEHLIIQEAINKGTLTRIND